MAAPFQDRYALRYLCDIKQHALPKVTSKIVGSLSTFVSACGITVQVRDGHTSGPCWARAPAMCPPYPHPGVRHRQRSGIDRVLPKAGAQHRIPRPHSVARTVRAHASNHPSRPPGRRGRRARRAVAGRSPAVGAVAPAASAAHLTSARPVPAVGSPVLTKGAPGADPTTQCQAQMGIACYSPVQYRVAYDLNPLYNGKALHRAITGAGRTIVIVDRSGPRPSRTTSTCSTRSGGCPTPTCRSCKFGNIPPFDPTDSTMVGWAEETTLDVEYAHSIAPGAKIVLARLRSPRPRA